MAVSFGVKTKLCALVPMPGVVFGFSHAKVPATEATPPLSTEAASVCPKTMGEAVGLVLMAGLACATTTFTQVVKVL